MLAWKEAWNQVIICHSSNNILAKAEGRGATSAIKKQKLAKWVEKQNLYLFFRRKKEDTAKYQQRQNTVLLQRLPRW